MLAEEVHVFYFEHSKLKVPLLYPGQDTQYAVRQTIKVIPATYMAVNMYKVHLQSS